MNSIKLNDEHHFSGFACQCGAEARTEMDALRALAVERKQVSSTSHWFVTGALYHLIESYFLDLTWLAFDQWGGLKFETDKDDPDQFSLRIEFDIFEDGLAMALDQCYQRWGQYRQPNDIEDEESGSNINE